MDDLPFSELIKDHSKDRQRRSHHKVKTGCEACKIRRRKCDERKPVCSGCTRYGTDCSYPRHGGNIRYNPEPIRSTSSTASVAKVTRLTSAPENARVSTPQDLNLEDLELLHQYLTSTCMATSQRPEVTVQIQRSVPQLAQEHPFFMRGILAEAAVHLSWLRPTQEQHYTLLAAKHHGIALPEFRSTLLNINEHNYSAVIAYSFTLVWCAFARHTMSSTKELTSQTGGKADWLPEWFSLLRGSCLIVESCRIWITNGTHVLPKIDDPLEFSQSRDNRQITDLMDKLVPQSKSLMCENVITSLRRSFALSQMQHHNTPLRNAINFWIGTLPNEYITLVQKGEPWALVVMAHFCVIVHRSETRWFMKGHAARLLQQIVERLGNPWEQYLQWPCEELDLQQQQI